MEKVRARRNRTITLTDEERDYYAGDLIRIETAVDAAALEDRLVNQDVFEVLGRLPRNCVDLLILDPPYNLTKTFNSTTFRKKSPHEYEQWFDQLLIKLLGLLKSTASVYVCSEWYTSTAVHLCLEKHLKVRSRITWEREKGRGAKRNWKNASEDIWFATLSDDYVFNVGDVKLKRRVLAPYTDAEGAPKDWENTPEGQFRLTHPSNLWNDITVPFWSMPENTDHPTQKAEKLLAKLILASSRENDLVFDPFAGVCSTLVVAKKLNRRFFGIEIEKEYCLLGVKRLDLAEADRAIQGYHGGVFWERNSLAMQQRNSRKRDRSEVAGTLF